MNNVKNGENAYFLNADVILKFLIEEDDKLDTLLIYNPNKQLVTSDYAVYEALASSKPYDNMNINKLKKFFEVVDVISYRTANNKDKPQLTEERVEQIRKAALTKKNEGDKK